MPAKNTSRPGTARSASRPGTGRASSSRGLGSFVVAISEGRNIGREVGVAAVDRNTGRVTVMQVADCQTYVKTLLHLSLHPPAIIIAPDTFFPSLKGTKAKSILLEHIREELPDVPLVSYPRKFWNNQTIRLLGLHFVSELSTDDNERAGLLLTIHDRFYALQAVSAVFKYIEEQDNIIYPPHTLVIKYRPIEGSMLIDTETARNLELLEGVSKQKTHSLFGLLNKTFTPQGARLLRTTILCPMASLAPIEARLSAVSELVQTEETFTAVRDALKGVQKVDLDKLIVQLAATVAGPEVGETVKGAYDRMGQLLDLQKIIRNIPRVGRATAECGSALLRVIGELVSDQRLRMIDERISEDLNESSTGSKKGAGSGLMAVMARVYAVKAERDPLLDVARASFKENVEDIHELTNTLREKHELPIELVYQKEGGGGFTLKLDRSHTEEAGWERPREWIDRVSRKKHWILSTLELKKLNAKMREMLDETLMISAKIIKQLLTDVLADIAILYKASEAIALLDILWSFSKRSIGEQAVRPEFTGTLAIKSGRHPLLETVQAAGTLVPNDVYASESSSFQIIQGPVYAPNSDARTGKSTYIRQIALLSIMSMCGCFVPAEYASFKVFDALLTRLSNEDDFERSLSTFSNEMVTSSMILGLATKESLVLVDELGRGTSSQEGIGIAHAIAEELVDRKCMTFFTTHFSDLSTTLSRYPAVVNLHLSVQNTSNNPSGLSILFNYRICDGTPEGGVNYGLELAHLADLPPDVPREAKRVALLLMEREKARKAMSADSQVNLRRKTIVKLAAQLKQILNVSTLPDEELMKYLLRVQTSVGLELDKTFGGPPTD
ncbi:hypothetical protein M408DRAFT_81053 [Serendipita vermifera MAFF 305830]|uniref:DNA mismatch repair protein MSH3 n=1 Tax=Serendipita vermifera MAFF 305830 TaxID=933852 RepID=A0A0C3AP72_SERVB|nr:hypothetical protein M408DRAFT_81053 [Serendipita vermifera MAFF 305830]